MKCQIIFILLITYFIISETKKKKKKKSNKNTQLPIENSNVLEITKNNTNLIRSSLIGKYMILFYDSFDRMTIEMNSAYNNLSKMNDSDIEDIKFFRVNSKKLRKFTDEFGGYVENPALFLFCQDEDMSYHYEGPIDSSNLLMFIKKMITIQIPEVKSFKELNSLKHRGSNILLVGNYSDFQDSFNTIAKYSKKVFKNAFWSNHQYFYDKYGIYHGEMDAVAYFTINGTLNEGERMNFTPDEINKHSILKLTEIYSRKPFTDVTAYKLEKIIENKLKAIILIHKADASHKDQEKLDAIFNTLAKKYREEYWVLKTNSSKHISTVFYETFHIEEEKLPFIGLVDNLKTSNIDLDCYRLENNNNISLSSLEEFILNHKQGKLKRIIISESEHEETHDENELEDHSHLNQTELEALEEARNSEPMGNHLITANSFDKLILNNFGKDVVLFICADSQHCDDYHKRYNRVSEKMIMNDHLFFGRINFALNEIPGVNITKIPALIMVPDISKNKNKRVMIYDQKEFRTAEMISFIKKFAANPIGEVLNSKHDDKHWDEEQANPTKYILTTNNENIEDRTSHSYGNGFIRAVHRYLQDFNNNRQEFEEFEPEDHDSEEYDEIGHSRHENEKSIQHNNDHQEL